MLEQHGMRCDVCGEFILMENARPFELGFINGTLLAHTRSRKCLDAMRAASEADDITMLPDGPIRRAYEAELARRSMTHQGGERE
ncbi:MAG: hypothetical protein WC538_22035 [Thermoanaerobaculia bacterium]|jgi:hypothetical protein